MPVRGLRSVETLHDSKKHDHLRPWTTVRNALGVLPNPVVGKIFNFQNHDHQPGVRPYPGDTGSPVALPAKALKVEDHGVLGGENMLVLLDGRLRYLTI